MKHLALALLCAGAASTHVQVHAQDRADIDRTQIVGNRELPKVLTIVPWKKPLPGALAGRPVASVLDEALAPVDRAVFRREVSYGTQLQAQRLAPGAAATSNPVPPIPAAAPAPAPASAHEGENR